MKNNKDKGNYYEEVACEFLIAKGYVILERNYNTLYGEIDIICKINDDIIFVEVKYRKNINYGYPKEAVGIKKQGKIKNTSLIYISENDINNVNFRYDVISILDEDINHIENAFW